MLSKTFIHCVRLEYVEGYFWSVLFCFSVELKGLFYVCGNGGFGKRKVSHSSFP